MIAKLKLTAYLLTIAVAIGLVSPNMLSSIGLVGRGAVANTIFFDDFEDENIADGQPVSWQSDQGASLQIQDGSLVISGFNVPLAVPSVEPLSDVSIQVQMRLLEGEYAGIGARRTRGGPRTGYFAAVGEYLNMGVLTNEAFIAYSGSVELLDAKDVNFDPKLEDVILQLDIIGNRITYWAWPADEARPVEPLGSVIDDEFTSGGIYIWASSAGLADDLMGRTAFRYVRVADVTIIPEPPAAALAFITATVLGLWWWPHLK
jgi:hypothetical protein